MPGYDQVIVTTPTGEQVKVLRWRDSGNWEADWRPTSSQRDVWVPFGEDNWRVEEVDA